MNIKTVPDAEAQVADDRARLIAGLREFADFLKANPWAPVTRTSGYLANANFQVDLHGPGPLGADADLDTVDRVRQIADWLGVKTSESSDRTDASIQIGSVSYSVIAWHKSGRPDKRDTELARLRARNAELESQLSGLAYSREHHEADDPRPVSPARGGQPHVVAMTDEGLVDETPADPATLSAAIHFSATRREAARLAGRTTLEPLRAATLDLLHEQALDEDTDRARRADVREGEQGRITNPDLARFLAEKEEKRRTARHFLGLEESAKHYPAEPVSESR